MNETYAPQPDWTAMTLPAVSSESDRRAAPRRRVMWKAEADGASCGVRDLNDGGARISLPSAHALDGRLILSIRHRNADYPAEVVWRSGFAAGLRFLGSSRLN